MLFEFEEFGVLVGEFGELELKVLDLKGLEGAVVWGILMGGEQGEKWIVGLKVLV